MLQARVYLITLDPAELDDSVKFAETEFRPVVERLPGSLGISLFTNPEIGVAVLESFWASRDQMRLSEQMITPGCRGGLRRPSGTVSAERYRVPVFEQQAPLSPGSGLRLTRMDVDPARVEDAVQVYGDTVVPSLADTGGFGGTLLLADRDSGRLIGEAVWRNDKALAASRGIEARERVSLVEATGCAIQAVEEYGLLVNSVRKPSP